MQLLMLDQQISLSGGANQYHDPEESAGEEELPTSFYYELPRSSHRLTPPNTRHSIVTLFTYTPAMPMMAESSTAIATE